MSDHITVEGKKYFEESYLQLANNNTQRAADRIDVLENTLRDIAGFAPGNGDVCEIIARRARKALCL